MSKTTKLTGGLLFTTCARGSANGGGVHGMLLLPDRTRPRRTDGGDPNEVLIDINGTNGDDCRRSIAERFRTWARELEDDFDDEDEASAARFVNELIPETPRRPRDRDAIDEETASIAQGPLSLDVEMARDMGFTDQQIVAAFKGLKERMRELLPDPDPTSHRAVIATQRAALKRIAAELGRMMFFAALLALCIVAFAPLSVKLFR